MPTVYADNAGRFWHTERRTACAYTLPMPFDRRLTDAGRLTIGNRNVVLLEGEAALAGQFFGRYLDNNAMLRLFRSKP